MQHPMHKHKWIGQMFEFLQIQNTFLKTFNNPPSSHYEKYTPEQKNKDSRFDYLY